MNIEFVSKETLVEAESLERRGDGESLRKAATVLLMKKEEGMNEHRETNCSPLLNSILKRLSDDPYKCLDLNRSATETEIKKAYRLLALKCHPDKNAGKTSVLFAAIQSAYALLNDESKRKAYDLRCQKREAEKDRLRRKKKDKSPVRSTPSTNSFHFPPQSAAEAKQRDFNRKFYNEYRHAAMNRRPPPPPGGPASQKSPHSTSTHFDTAASTSPRDTKHASKKSSPQQKSPATSPRQEPPAKPTELRSTSKSHDTVTLEWNPGLANAAAAASKAYELQWRLRSDDKPSTWETSQQLILRTTCRKRNLRPSSCYEFRVRAASISGWSPHSAPLMILTLSEPGAKPKAKTNDESPPASAEKSTEFPKVKRNSTDNSKKKKFFASKDPWQCIVCKRTNATNADKCAVCGTRKDYDWSAKPDTAHTGATPKYDPRGNSNDAPYTSGNYNKTPRHEDDEAEPTWAFSDNDVPNPEKDTYDDDIDQWADEPASPATQKAWRAAKSQETNTHQDTLWLNPEVTCLHNVRQEPIKGSPIVGHLVADTEIIVVAEAGNWIKCKYHKPYNDENGNAVSTSGEGWCLLYDDEFTFVIKDNFAYPAARNNTHFGNTSIPEETEEEVIYELRDEDNRVYFFNCYTGVSMWEPPEWIDEIDEKSGAVYYTNSKTGETQWERPFDFVPIVREELYSTNQAAFVKSILSPKRSEHNFNHNK